MDRVIRILCAPGARKDITGIATTQTTSVSSQDVAGKTLESKTVPNTGPESTETRTDQKIRLLDRCLDRVVAASGSGPVFLFILGGLLTWAFLGIKFANSPSGTDWQISISNIQAIMGYAFDSLLMRQQLNDYEARIRVSASLRSRATSVKRMLRRLMLAGNDKDRKITAERFRQLQQDSPFAAELPSESLVGHICTWASFILGHIVTVGLFWVGMIVWIAFGKYCGWSVTWQLYINSSTSAFMVLMFGFLANIRERHIKYTETCLRYVYEVDAAVESRLRQLTGDELPNEAVIIPAPKVSRLQRIIFYYADVVGTLVGIALLVIVMAIWVSIGPAMHFNSNWWLIIGTYAGLIGMHDGFVLRNVQQEFDDHVDEAFRQARYDELDVLSHVLTSESEDEQYDTERQTKTCDKSITYRASLYIGKLCAHAYTVVLGVITIVGLLIGATIMGWSETGQLLCNIPPSIIESFIMMILITGHNIADADKRVEMKEMYVNRLGLFAYVERWDGGAVGEGEDKTFTIVEVMDKIVDGDVIIAEKGAIVAEKMEESDGEGAIEIEVEIKDLDV